MRKKNKKNIPSENRKKTDSLKIAMARVFLFINAVLWLAYVVYIYYDMAVVNHNTSSADIAALFVFINAVAMLYSGIVLGKPSKWVYYFALVATAINVLFSLLNILDLSFLVSFIIDLLILWAIIPLRKKYPAGL
jgi:hypothetical protein